MTVEYEGTDFNELTAFFRWRGTVLPAVLCRPIIWVLLLIRFGARLFRRNVLKSGGGKRGLIAGMFARN